MTTSTIELDSSLALSPVHSESPTSASLKTDYSLESASFPAVAQLSSLSPLTSDPSFDASSSNSEQISSVSELSSSVSDLNMIEVAPLSASVASGSSALASSLSVVPSSSPSETLSSSSSSSSLSTSEPLSLSTSLVPSLPSSSNESKSVNELENALQQLKAECERSQRDAVWTPAELEMLSELNQANVEDLFCESLKTSNWQYFRSKVMQVYPFYERVSLLSSDPRLHGRLTELLMIQTKVRPELLQYCLGDGRNGRQDRLALDRFDARLGFLLFDYIRSMPSVLCGIIEAYVQFDFRLQVKEWLYKNVNVWVWMRGSHSSWLTRVLYSDEENLLETLQKEFDVMTPVVKFTKRLSQEEKDSLNEIVAFILEKLSSLSYCGE